MSENAECDLLIVGGGPAGLSAAINGASEGLSVRMVDSGFMLGGQARESAAIENYPGFPESVTGRDLMARFASQALKFETDFICPTTVSRLYKDDKRFIATTDDYQQIITKAVLLATGLSYRRLGAKGMGTLMGRGVYYGVPPSKPSKGAGIIVVGGANSAGQAVMRFAADPTAKVMLVVRRKLEDQMSTYLVNRIRKQTNIEVCEGTEVGGVDGTIILESVTLITTNGELRKTVDCDLLCIFIGATPRTLWLESTVTLDEKKFIVTDGTRRGALPFETSLEGCFAAGDVRAGSTKRIASAIGEGAGALQMVHQHLARLAGVLPP